MVGRTANQKWNRRIDRYRKARREGIQPMDVSDRSIDEALRRSDQQQEAFRADRASIQPRERGDV
jgi:hypothetical protein